MSLSYHELEAQLACVTQERDALRDVIAPFRHTPEDRELWQDQEAFIREVRELREADAQRQQAQTERDKWIQIATDKANAIAVLRGAIADVLDWVDKCDTDVGIVIQTSAIKRLKALLGTDIEADLAALRAHRDELSPKVGENR